MGLCCAAAESNDIVLTEESGGIVGKYSFRPHNASDFNSERFSESTQPYSKLGSLAGSNILKFLEDENGAETGDLMDFINDNV